MFAPTAAPSGFWVHAIRIPLEDTTPPTSTAPPVEATYFQDWVKCGKLSCSTCQEGYGHGPYCYAYWTENGKTKKYIGKQRLAELETRMRPAAQALAPPTAAYAPEGRQ